MLIDIVDLEILGEAVFAMVDDLDYNPDAFWVLTNKIIHGIVYSNKKMAKFPVEWKDLCEYNALLKVVANVRRFSISKWNLARNKSGLVAIDKPYKGVYEYIHLIAVRNIYNTINKCVRNQDKDRSMSSRKYEMCDIADIMIIADMMELDAKINIEWIENRIGYKFTEGDEDE